MPVHSASRRTKTDPDKAIHRLRIERALRSLVYDCGYRRDVDFAITVRDGKLHLLCSAELKSTILQVFALNKVAVSSCHTFA